MKVNRNDCHLASLFSALDFFSFHAVAWQKKRNFLFFFFFGLIFFFSFFFAAAPVIRRVNVLGPNSPNEKCYRVSFFFTEFFFSFFTSTPLARFLMRKQLMQIHFYFWKKYLMELYLVLLGFLGFSLVLLNFIGFYRVLLALTYFFLVQPRFTGFYLVFPSFT